MATDETMGQRLETFRPKDEYGRGLTNKAWAELIGIGETVLGAVLRDAQDCRTSTINAIDKWLISQGETDATIRWWRLGRRRTENNNGVNGHTSLKLAPHP